MIRGGHIDLAILGAMQVSEHGDLANWMIPGKRVKGMGGAMDLVSGVRRVLVLMEHTTPHGGAKLMRHCTLPLTGTNVVHRVITDLCVVDVTPAGFEVFELADGVTREQVEEKTEARLHFYPVASCALLLSPHRLPLFEERRNAFAKIRSLTSHCIGLHGLRNRRVQPGLVLRGKEFLGSGQCYRTVSDQNIRQRSHALLQFFRHYHFIHQS